MKEYHKIQTVFKRDPKTNNKTLLEGEYSLPEFAYLQNNLWLFTEKVDGTNIRVKCEAYQEEGKAYGITFGGKTDNAQIPSALVEKLQARFHCDSARSLIAEILPDGACLYGEGYGAKIQKGGGNYRQNPDFVLFDVKIGDIWLRREDVEDIAIKLNLDIVPVLDMGTIGLMIDMARKGFKSEWGDFQAEGIVARPSTELRTRRGDRIITKIKRKDFH